VWNESELESFNPHKLELASLMKRMRRRDNRPMKGAEALSRELGPWGILSDFGVKFERLKIQAPFFTAHPHS
jgi:hypothetical protein